MILKFWPRWPRKRPLNLSSLGGCPLDFFLNYISEISGFHWSKWAIDCLIRETFIFQIFNFQPPRLLTNLKNGFHWSKCTVECAIYSTLILKSAQTRCALMETIFKAHFLLIRIWAFKKILSKVCSKIWLQD